MEESIKLQLFFQTLGDSNRLKIIGFIGDKECSVSEIVEATGLSQPLVSHHLRTLRENKILETKRSGPFVYYNLKDQRLLSALGILLDIVSEIENEKKDNLMFCSPPWWDAYWDNKK